MIEYEYIYPFPEMAGTTYSRTEFKEWMDRCKKMQAWCNDQGFNWYYRPKKPPEGGAIFSFEQPEDLTLFLLRWA